MFNLTDFGLPIAVGVSIAIYCIAIMVMPKRLFSEQSLRVREALKRIENEYQVERLDGIEVQDPVEVMMRNPLVRAFVMVPGAKRLLPLLHEAGLAQRIDAFFIGLVVALLVALLVAVKFGAMGVLFAVAGTPLFVLLVLRRLAQAQRKRALDVFPEALDMIVRSVKAGYPLNTALGIVAENMPPPMSEEFKRMVHELTVGAPVSEVVTRFANRMDDGDVRFFAVVVGIQQESGGNLSEILAGISRVIRQRRQLKLRIRALSAEGRATAWIIGGLVVALTLTINIIAPEHLSPLWHTESGNHTVLVIVLLMLTGVLLIRRIIDVEV